MVDISCNLIANVSNLDSIEKSVWLFFSARPEDSEPSYKLHTSHSVRKKNCSKLSKVETIWFPSSAPVHCTGKQQHNRNVVLLQIFWLMSAQLWPIGLKHRRNKFISCTNVLERNQIVLRFLCTGRQPQDFNLNVVRLGTDDLTAFQIVDFPTPVGPREMVFNSRQKIITVLWRGTKYLNFPCVYVPEMLC